MAQLAVESQAAGGGVRVGVQPWSKNWNLVLIIFNLSGTIIITTAPTFALGYNRDRTIKLHDCEHFSTLGLLFFGLFLCWLEITHIFQVVVLSLHIEVFVTVITVRVKQRQPPEYSLVTEADVELGLGGDLALEVRYLDLGSEIKIMSGFL